RFRDDRGERNRAEVALVAKRIHTDLHEARRGIDDRIRVIAARCEGRRRNERLHARARLEDVRRRAIAVARGRDLVPVVGVVRRLIDHREHFAGVDVEHDERARLRVMLLYGGLELAVRELPNAKTDARVQIRAWTRCSNALDVFDGPSVPILDDALRAGRGTKPTIVGELESFLADIVVLLREPEQMTRDFAGRIETLIFAQQIDAWDL